MKKIKMIFSLGCVGFLLDGAALAQAPVTITVASSKVPGFTVPSNFTGLSFEAQTALPGADGKYLFRSDNWPLINLFQTLGIKSLRVGGNTADHPCVPVPGPADIGSLFAFTKAADVKIIIYTLRLRNGSTTNTAAIANYIEEHYPLQLACFAIGNEPNFYNAGAKDVSDTFASALWGLDFLHWWAAHNASGINFHTGDMVAAGSASRFCWYATFWSSGRGYDIHPIGYAIKAFNLRGHGRVEPLTISNPDGINLTAYAVRNGGSLFVTIINKEHDAGAKAAKVTIISRENSIQAAAIFLSAPGNNLAAKTDVTPGGAAIRDDGWNGEWTPLTSHRAGQCTIVVPVVSVAIVRLSLE